MLRLALWIIVAAALIALGCRPVDVPPPRTPTPVLTMTPTPAPTAKATTPAAITRNTLPPPPEFEDAEGDPHGPIELMEQLSSTGLEFQSLHGLGGQGVCAFDPSAPPSASEFRFTAHLIIVGNDDASAAVAVLIYRTENDLAEDWAIDTDGKAALPDPDVCAVNSRFAGSVSLGIGEFFGSTGYDESSAIGRGNIIIAFPFGSVCGSQLGGDGLDPEIRAEIVRLILTLGAQ